VINKQFTVRFWIYVDDNFDTREIDITAESGEQAIEKAKALVPNRAKYFEIL
tara:strand:+ start:13312 stop:13467 length:156 start_codon:yes stop_codon:yes gene_type:complete